MSFISAICKKCIKNSGLKGFLAKGDEFSLKDLSHPALNCLNSFDNVIFCKLFVLK